MILGLRDPLKSGLGLTPQIADTNADGYPETLKSQIRIKGRPDVVFGEPTILKNRGIAVTNAN